MNEKEIHDFDILLDELRAWLRFPDARALEEWLDDSTGTLGDHDAELDELRGLFPDTELVSRGIRELLDGLDRAAGPSGVASITTGRAKLRLRASLPDDFDGRLVAALAAAWATARSYEGRGRLYFLTTDPETAEVALIHLELEGGEAEVRVADGEDEAVSVLVAADLGPPERK